VEEEIRDPLFNEKFLKPQPIVLDVSGALMANKTKENIDEFITRSIETKGKEEFDAIKLKSFKQAKVFNSALEVIKMKLQGRDLIGITLTDCFFSAKNEEELINGELLLQLCSKAYMLEIYSCQFRQNEAIAKDFLVNLL